MTPEVLSDCHVDIPAVGKGGTDTQGPPLATPLVNRESSRILSKAGALKKSRPFRPLNFPPIRGRGGS